MDITCSVCQTVYHRAKSNTEEYVILSNKTLEIPGPLDGFVVQVSACPNCRNVLFFHVKR